jgi:hypothetical protein
MRIFGSKSIRRLVAATAVTGSLMGVLASSASADLGYTTGATIKQTGLDVHGTWAQLQWTANVASTKLDVSLSQPKLVNGKWTFDSTVLSTTVSKENGAFTKTLSGLIPAHTYKVILTTPQTESLASTQALGQFTTLARTQVVVTFDEIHVIDDADGWGKGAGDLWWYFNTTFSGWSTGWHRPADSGDTFAVDFHHPNSSHGIGSYVATGANVPNAFMVQTQALEDDIGVGDWSCIGEWETPAGLPYQESNTCAESAYASKTVILPTYIFESVPQPFTLLTDRGAVKFSVTGTFRAIYS